MGIDPKQLASLLQSQNQIINTGEIRAGEQQLRVTANGMYTTVDDIRNQVITTKAGQVKLGDIAVIEKGYMDPPSNIMHVNGKRAIGIGVSTDPQRDVVQTGKNVKAKLDELLPLMPVGLELQSLYLENEIANEANNGFIINLIESILIVIDGFARRCADRLVTDFLYWRHIAYHVFLRCRAEPYFIGGIYHRHGDAGG